MPSGLMDAVARVCGGKVVQPLADADNQAVADQDGDTNRAGLSQQGNHGKVSQSSESDKAVAMPTLQV